VIRNTVRWWVVLAVTSALGPIMLGPTNDCSIFQNYTEQAVTRTRQHMTDTEMHDEEDGPKSHRAIVPQVSAAQRMLLKVGHSETLCTVYTVSGSSKI
jgi:hypothetical protein